MYLQALGALVHNLQPMLFDNLVGRRNPFPGLTSYQLWLLGSTIQHTVFNFMAVVAMASAGSLLILRIRSQEFQQYIDNQSTCYSSTHQALFYLYHFINLITIDLATSNHLLYLCTTITLSNSNSEFSKTSVFLNTFNQRSLTSGDFMPLTPTCSDPAAFCQVTTTNDIRDSSPTLKTKDNE